MQASHHTPRNHVRNQSTDTLAYDGGLEKVRRPIRGRRSHLFSAATVFAVLALMLVGCGPDEDDGKPRLTSTSLSGGGTSVGGTGGSPAGGGGAGPATCTNEVHDGDETDEDCGGPNCGPCEAGKGCLNPTDCISLVCADETCQAASCNDGVTNGDESDTDCGASCPSLCNLGQSCDSFNDCLSGNCDSNQCSCQDEMDEAPAPGGGAYCIDKTEVVYEDYELFYAANPPLSTQSAECQWNTDYTPSIDWPSLDKHKPVVGINWCEAQAYCTWRGKRLCGRIGGGANPFSSHADASESQWYNACSAQGNNTYPYGNAYAADSCNGADKGTQATIDVQNTAGAPVTDPPCFGGTPDLWQMSGNVAEWEDSCDDATGSNDNCRVRGGSYMSADMDLTCSADSAAARSFTSGVIGFHYCI